MRKTFTFLMGLVLSMALSPRVMAQEEDVDLTGWHLNEPEITSVSQLTSNSGDDSEGSLAALIDEDEGTFWHADWHGIATKTRPYQFEVSFSEELNGYYGVKIGRRKTSSNHPTVVRIDEQLGDGWATVGTAVLPYRGEGTMEYTAPMKFTHTKMIRVVVPETTSNTTGDGTWHMSEFQVYGVDAAVAAPACLIDLFTYYTNLLPLNVGTERGQYGDLEAYEALTSALETAGEYISTEQFPAAEEVDALISTIIESYRKVIASEILFSCTDGYYRIMSALKYKEEVETGETDIEGNPVTETNYVDKAMYSVLEGAGRWGTKDENDCRQVWKITPTEAGFRVVNAATDMQYTRGQGSLGLNMAVTADNLSELAFDFQGTDADGKDIILIRYADVDRGANQYFHQQGHGKGTGKDGSLCTWQNTYDMGMPYDSDKGTSEWYLEPVSEEEAQALIDAFALVKNHDQLVINYRDTVAVAKAAIEIAKDLRGIYEIDKEAPVIQETSWFHSVSSDESEGSLDNLLDGNAGTFWHSNWHDGDHGAHYHSLDVCFPEPITGWYETYIIRRSGQTSNNWVEVSLYGTNDESLLENVEDTGWELICKTVSTPYTNNQYDQYSQPFEVAKAYKYWRFYEDVTGSQATYGNCGHLGDFQIYPAAKVRNSQFEGMGEIATKLETLVEQAADLDMDALTVEQYNELCEAWAAFKGALVDPAALRSAIASAKSAAGKAIVGNDPGCWSDESAVAALTAAIDKAQAYDNAASYTKDGMDAVITDLQQEQETFWGKVNPIRTDKWYTIGFSDFEVFEEHNWTSDGKSAIYGTVAVPGARDENDVVIPNASPVEGSEMFFVSTVEPEEEMAQFRFIAVTDSTYAIQHRTTGLYIGRKTSGWSIGDGFRLCLSPIYFEHTTLGLGQNLLTGYRLDGQDWERCNINAWNNANGSLLAGWNDFGIGGNSSLAIHEIEDIEEPDFTTVKTIHEGEMLTFCYPIDLSVESAKAKAYTAAGCYVSEGTKYLALSEEVELAAGQPFVVIASGDAINTEAEVALDIIAGGKVALEPLTENGLVGVYYEDKVPEGDLIFTQETDEAGNVTAKQVVSDGKKKTADNTAYVEFTSGEEPDDYDVAIALDGDIADHDAIENVLATVAKPGNVYNAAGQLVRKGATLADVKALGRGLYILNGTKIMVK